jgi:hypothetical protein
LPFQWRDFIYTTLGAAAKMFLYFETRMIGSKGDFHGNSDFTTRVEATRLASLGPRADQRNVAVLGEDGKKRRGDRR